LNTIFEINLNSVTIPVNNYGVVMRQKPANASNSTSGENGVTPRRLPSQVSFITADFISFFWQSSFTTNNLILGGN
jgi:hypothetical protein